MFAMVLIQKIPYDYCSMAGIRVILNLFQDLELDSEINSE